MGDLMTKKRKFVDVDEVQEVEIELHDEIASETSVNDRMTRDFLWGRGEFSAVSEMEFEQRLKELHALKKRGKQV